MLLYEFSRLCINENEKFDVLPHRIAALPSKYDAAKNGTIHSLSAKLAR